MNKNQQIREGERGIEIRERMFITLLLATHGSDGNTKQIGQLLTPFHPPKMVKQYYITLKSHTFVSSFNNTCMKRITILSANHYSKTFKKGVITVIEESENCNLLFLMIWQY